MTTIHHAITKSAAKHGMTIEPRDDSFVVIRDGAEIAIGSSAKQALADALAVVAPKPAKKAKSVKPAKAKKANTKGNGHDVDTDDDDEYGERSNSVVKSKYREKYQPHKFTCGDTLALRLRKEFMRKNEDGKLRLDWPSFTKFAKANQVWVGEYMQLNPGMRRMNIINRLRARVRQGEKIVW